MSKKELLSESQIRRFMTLANLEPLAKNVISENTEEESLKEEYMDASKGLTSEAEDEETETDSEEEVDVDVPDEESETEDSGDEDVAGDDMGGGEEVSPEIMKAFETTVQSLADSLGIKINMSGDSAAGSADMAPQAPTDEMQEAKEMDEKKKPSKKKKDEEESKQMKESSLSEDGLVEAVLARVTARLVQEAKKKGKNPKAKMEALKKKKEAEKKAGKVMEEALEGVNLAEKGGKDQKNVWKGHADMTMAKGEKGGKGGHEMETVTAKSEHTVTHGGKNLATLGGNKKK